MKNKEWNFVYIADIQPGSPRSYRYNPAWMENWLTAKKQIIELKPEFVLVGGDITRDGTLHDGEFEEMKNELDSMGVKYHAIAGNMDVGNKCSDIQGAVEGRRDPELNITSQNLARYEKYFGPSQWSFIYKNVRITGFCDMLMGSGLQEEKGLWNFLEALPTLQACEHHLVLTHYAMFIQHPDEKNYDISNLDEYYDWYFSIDYDHRKRLLPIFQKSGVSRVVTGHIHCRKDFNFDDINYDLAPGTCFGQWHEKWPDGNDSLGFFNYKVNGNGITKEFIPLKKLSLRTDVYGPGGHPPEEEWNYSAARIQPPFKPWFE
jgi:predicted phosphodiesterase